MDERDNKALNSGLCNAKSIYSNIEDKEPMSKTEETNKLSAEEYLKLISRKDPKDYLVSLEHVHYAMESFAYMRVEQEKEIIRQFLISEGFEMLAEKI